MPAFAGHTTVRETFASYGSSLDNALVRDAASRLDLRPMNLPVAVGMEQHAVVGPITAAMNLPDDMVAMPARLWSDLLAAIGADTFLPLP